MFFFATVFSNLRSTFINEFAGHKPPKIMMHVFFFVVELYVFICLLYCIQQNKKCIPFSKCSHVLVCRCLMRAYDSNRIGSPSCSRNTAMYLCIAIFTAKHTQQNHKKNLTGCAKGSDRYDWGEVEDSIKVILADGERGSGTGSAILQCHLWD